MSKRSNELSKTVAVAGGTGGVGQHVVEELLRTNKLNVVLLLRQENPVLTASLRARFPQSASRLDSVVVSYSDATTLAATLAQHNVDTVISSLSTRDAAGHKTTQRALLTASEATPSVRRFAPSDWAVGISDTDSPMSSLYDPKRDIIPLLRASTLNWQAFTPGLFMNYLGSNAPTAHGEPATGHLNPLKLIIDVENATAGIPIRDDGSESPIVLTRIQDVGKYVAQACLLDGVGWAEGQGRIRGWRGTCSQVVTIAERITSKPFQVTRIPVSALKSSIDPSHPIMQTFYTEVQIAIAEGGGDWEDDVLGMLLEKNGLGFAAQSVEDSLMEWWGKV